MVNRIAMEYFCCFWLFVTSRPNIVVFYSSISISNDYVFGGCDALDVNVIAIVQNANANVSVTSVYVFCCACAISCASNALMISICGWNQNLIFYFLEWPSGLGSITYRDLERGLNESFVITSTTSSSPSSSSSSLPWASPSPGRSPLSALVFRKFRCRFTVPGDAATNVTESLLSLSTVVAATAAVLLLTLSSADASVLVDGVAPDYKNESKL